MLAILEIKSEEDLFDASLLSNESTQVPDSARTSLESNRLSFDCSEAGPEQPNQSSKQQKSLSVCSAPLHSDAGSNSTNAASSLPAAAATNSLPTISEQNTKKEGKDSKGNKSIRRRMGFGSAPVHQEPGSNLTNAASSLPASSEINSRPKTSKREIEEEREPLLSKDPGKKDASSGPIHKKRSFADTFTSAVKYLYNLFTGKSKKR